MKPKHSYVGLVALAVVLATSVSPQDGTLAEEQLSPEEMQLLNEKPPFLPEQVQLLNQEPQVLSVESQSSGIIYLRDSGRSDPSVGKWESATHTGTLTKSLAQPVRVDGVGITLDGAGHTITGSGSGAGVALYGTTGVTIKNVNIHGWEQGIYLSASTNMLISNNASNNLVGIRLTPRSSNNTITGNTTSNNIIGIYLWFSPGNTVTGNIVSNNSSHGIYDYISSNCIVTDNIVSGNSRGIFLSYFNNIVAGNTIARNTQHGIYVWSYGNNNKIYRNNFIGNSPQAYVSGPNPDRGNVFNLDMPDGGNYWSDYAGEDTNGDGIGDTPYIFTGGQDNLPWIIQDGWGAPPPPPPTPAELLIDELIDCVLLLNLHEGIENSLDAKLDAALNALDDINSNNDFAAINSLNAFIDAVNVQRGTKIPEADADRLIAKASYIVALLSEG